MKRKSLLAFATAGAITAIVVLTTGAFAGTSGRSDQPGNGNAAFISCLASHGVQVPSNDPGTLKRWLGEHQSDPAVQAALKACAPPGPSSNGDVSGTTPAELVACLEQHGVDVPSNVKNTPDTIKEWLHGAMQQPTVKAALDACQGGPTPNEQKKQAKRGGRRRGGAPRARGVDGHESSTITERLYIHLFDRQRTDEQVREAMGSALQLSVAESSASSRRGVGSGLGGQVEERLATVIGTNAVVLAVARGFEDFADAAPVAESLTASFSRRGQRGVSSGAISFLPGWWHRGDRHSGEVTVLQTLRRLSA